MEYVGKSIAFVAVEIVTPETPFRPSPTIRSLSPVVEESPFATASAAFGSVVYPLIETSTLVEVPVDPVCVSVMLEAGTPSSAAKSFVSAVRAALERLVTPVSVSVFIIGMSVSTTAGG